MDFLADIEPWVIALAGTFAVGAVVIIVSMFSIRETPFEEAVANRHQGFDLALDPSFSGKKQKDKNKDKNKDKSSKKPKEVKVVKPAKNSTEQENDKKTVVDKKIVVTVDEDKKEPSVVEASQSIPEIAVVQVKPASSAKSSKSDTKKHEHIEFSVGNTVVTLNEEEEKQLAERRVSTDIRPRKPILMKKSPVETELGDETKVVRGNSFETVHPKDEFELVKSKQLKQCEVVDGQVNGHGPEKVIDPANASNHSNKKHKNKSHVSVAAEPTQISTPKQLIDTVKNLALSDEDVQLVVNELLNKESANGGDSNWSSKNDPVAHLKKMLTEKEQALATESSNLQAAQARLRELRQEFAAEKTRNSSFQQTADRLRLEIQRQQLLIQQLTERHEVEIKALQSNLQSKLNDERNLAMAREEIKRLKELIKKLEAERSNLESIPRLTHEIEQLRNERSQSDRTIASLRSSGDESQRHAAMLDEHLKKLVSDRAQEESAREHQVKELRNQLQASESKVNSLREELQTLQNSKKEEDEGLKSQTDQRIKQILSLESENNALKASLSKNEADSSQQLNELIKLQEELRSELQSKSETINRLAKELEDERTSRGNSESEKESRFKALNDDLSRVLNEKGQVVDQLSELQVQNGHLNGEKSEVMNILRPLNLEGADQNNVVSLVKCLADLPKGIPGVDIGQLEKEKQGLIEQVDQIKEELSRKEEALKEMVNKSEEERRSSEERFKQIVSEKELVEKDRDRLSSDKKSLENTLKDLEGLQSTVTEMEEKLRDLQSKLESEELTKKELSSKYDEVRIEPEQEEATSNLVNLREQVETQGKELKQAVEEKERLVQLKEEMDATSEQLEKDKKSVKEIQVQNVRLKSLVKIGEDSLKAEQERVRQLEEQLKLKNGSAVANQVIVTSNGDGSDSPHNTSSTSLNQESVS